MGNPAADLDEARQSSWDEVGAALRPDFSVDSARAAAEVSGEQWRETGQDLWDQSVPGRIGRALDGESPVAGDLEELRGLGEIVE